jgi:hypothetical protein
MHAHPPFGSVLAGALAAPSAFWGEDRSRAGSPRFARPYAPSTPGWAYSPRRGRPRSGLPAPPAEQEAAGRVGFGECRYKWTLEIGLYLVSS